LCLHSSKSRLAFLLASWSSSSFRHSWNNAIARSSSLFFVYVNPEQDEKMQ
jgi:hypothetical protein